jgi:hypothetical protein
MEGTEMPMTGPNTSTEETQHVIEGGEFNACDYESLEDGKVSVRFEDTVYSSIADDEVAVTVIAVCSPAGGSGTSGWVLDDVSVTDQTGKPITIDAKDTDYLSSRAADFAHKYNGTPELVTSEDDSAMSGPNDVSLYDESPGDTVTIGRHTISREDKTVGREDPTQRLTYSFDNGYTLINFWGWELLDPSGHRLVHADKSSEINLTLKRMNLPTIDEIDDAFDAIDGSLEAGDSAYYDRQIGDMSP